MSDPLKMMKEMGHEQVVFCNDPVTGLKAIIAVHDTTLGPALGGTRMWDYADHDSALKDVLRLSRGMTYKAVVAGLNLGGGKAVIIGHPRTKSEALFRTFGRFVNSLAGRYITAEDVNINVHDMEYVAAETRYVTGISSRPGGSGDPSPVTAYGVFCGIKSSLKHRLGKDSVRGVKVGVQGAGSVGKYLCKYLAEEGAEILITDIDMDKAKKIADETRAAVIEPHKIISAQMDVFAPCALGGILNDESIPQLKCTIVAGGANNQLEDEKKHGVMCKDRKILYAPDYVINAGGLINVYTELRGYNFEKAKAQAGKIFDTLQNIYADSDRKNIPTYQASNELAENRIESMRKAQNIRHSLLTEAWFQ